MCRRAAIDRYLLAPGPQQQPRRSGVRRAAAELWDGQTDGQADGRTLDSFIATAPHYYASSVNNRHSAKRKCLFNPAFRGCQNPINGLYTCRIVVVKINQNAQIKAQLLTPEDK